MGGWGDMDEVKWLYFKTISTFVGVVMPHFHVPHPQDHWSPSAALGLGGLTINKIMEMGKVGGCVVGEIVCWG